MNEEAVQAAIDAALAGHTTINLEIYYWWCTAIMIAIHAGFLAYEMGASRSKNALASGVKNILAFAFMIPTFFAFGWFIYLAFYNWQPFSEGFSLLGSIDVAGDGQGGVPWSAGMGPNLQDQATGVFWAAFTLFACTTASIYSGAVIERIRLSAFIITAVFLGSVVWILGASWGWHPAGWMVMQWGFRDVAAAGVVHTIAGFFALGILIPLGPRIGKYNADGSANDLRGHNMPLTVTGLMLIILGFFGFLGACLIYDPIGQWTNIYGIPSNLSSFVFNTLMGMAGGIIGAYFLTRDPFWMMSGALGGIFSVASGLDLFYPPLAFLLGFVGGCIIPVAAGMLERMGIDDAVGAVAVHGVCGVWGVLAVGIFCAGYPGVGDMPAISFMGQFKGAVTLALLGFVPALVLGYLLRLFGLLRVRNEVEILGLDPAEIPSQAYPEFAVWEEAPAEPPRDPAPRDPAPRDPAPRDRTYRDAPPPRRDGPPTTRADAPPPPRREATPPAPRRDAPPTATRRDGPPPAPRRDDSTMRRPASLDRPKPPTRKP